MSLPASLVLLSGGLDSVVNAAQAALQTRIRFLLFFDYGQRARARELEAAQRVAERLHAPLEVLPLEWMARMDSGLTSSPAPQVDSRRLDDSTYTEDTARQVWVPNRNGVMINIAAALAEQHGLESIIVGFNREEAATFPDNTAEYLDRVNACLEYSTRNHPVAASYTIDMDKPQILEWGREIGAPLDSLWSCYEGGEQMCGLCESCQRLKRALREQHWLDPFQALHFRGFAGMTEETA